MDSDSDTIWSFGYGSNMDVVAMEAKKSVKVLGKYVLIISVPEWFMKLYCTITH